MRSVLAVVCVCLLLLNSCAKVNYPGSWPLPDLKLPSNADTIQFSTADGGATRLVCRIPGVSLAVMDRFDDRLSGYGWHREENTGDFGTIHRSYRSTTRKCLATIDAKAMGSGRSTSSECEYTMVCSF